MSTNPTDIPTANINPAPGQYKGSAPAWPSKHHKQCTTSATPTATVKPSPTSVVVSPTNQPDATPSIVTTTQKTLPPAVKTSTTIAHTTTVPHPVKVVHLANTGAGNDIAMVVLAFTALGLGSLSQHLGAKKRGH